MSRFRIEHVNTYHYANIVGLNYGEARLLPRAAAAQRVLERTLVMNPFVDDYRERDDAFGNRVVWFNLRQPHQSLSVTACSLIERGPQPQPAHSPAWESVVDQLSQILYGHAEVNPEVIAVREYCLPSPHAPHETAATDYVRVSFTPGRPLLAAVAELSARIKAEFAYRPNATQIDTPIAEVLAERHGVCQDFAHLALSGLRGLGLAARYVSGYLETIPLAGAPILTGVDASHAWISVFLPGQGWFDFDPTNGSPIGEGHLTLAWGRDYGDVAPLKGVIYGGGMHQLDVGVTVTRMFEAN
jgi:transglutaminase-like putative cysteine protease